MTAAARMTNTVQVQSKEAWETLCQLATSTRGSFDPEKNVGTVTFITKQAAEDARREV